MTEVIEEGKMAIIRLKVTKTLGELSESDVHADGTELIVRNIDEFLLLKRFREMRLTEARARAVARLEADSKNGVVPNHHGDDPSCKEHK